MKEPNKNDKKSSPWKSLGTGLAVLAGLIVYAYGFQITKIDLEQLRSERRQESLVRVTRALAQPDIFEYEQVAEAFTAPVHVTCPADGGIVEAPDTSGPYVTVTPSCAEPGEMVTVEGFKFIPNSSGPVRFVPGSDPTNVVELGNDTATTDADGSFSVAIKLPKRPSDEVQFIRVTMRRNVGTPQFTETARETWDKIIETVFLALLATTLGTILAIPLSFIAARNLMKSVRSPLTSIALSLLGWPLGIAVGYLLVSWVGTLSAPFAENIPVNVIFVVLTPILASLGLRWALPEEETSKPNKTTQVARLIVLFITVLVAFYGLFQLAHLAINVGLLGIAGLGSLAFLGNFLFQLGDIIAITTPVLGGLATGSALSSFLGRTGQRASERLAPSAIRLLNILFATLAGATLFGLFGWLVEWLYQIGQSVYVLWGPLIVGGLLGLVIALITKPKDTLSTGMVIYYVTRTILNGLRSVEALVMAIVFVIAVGIGPFAGVMALGLHTIVSLAKLYSEQVESIQPGPLEAIQATGANRLQTIIYAVIPQIVPPYISYTMYRWDINVRMSTIIGFVGGGGIGFLLQQNINLLNYRAASAQMLAIAIVVASMDYISSVLREKYV
ncbi:MAG TPA: ABC transporter permease subunit [Anaerolineales bacterium]|nr:ABC transporter permease subunit [Anaerolineales bacterium]HNS61531.1 ABC transporter permease subunit [Anaerolineales bacterium]